MLQLNYCRSIFRSDLPYSLFCLVVGVTDLCELTFMRVVSFAFILSSNGFLSDIHILSIFGFTKMNSSHHNLFWAFRIFVHCDCFFTFAPHTV